MTDRPHQDSADRTSPGEEAGDQSHAKRYHDKGADAPDRQSGGHESGQADPGDRTGDSATRSAGRNGTGDRTGAGTDSRDQRQSHRHPDSRSPSPEPGTSAATGTTRPQGWTGLVYDILSSVLAVLVVGGFLFAVSGVWPPLVAVESGSMVPNMQQGDLVFVMEEHRFSGPGTVADTGVVTAARGEETGYRTFGRDGDVIVYAPDGNTNRTPIIHRAMIWVEEGERWYDEVDTDAIADHLNTCNELPNCPAPHAGFITKGDNNGEYDQVNRLSGPVKPEWVVGTAEIRLPGLGWIRLGTQ